MGTLTEFLKQEGVRQRDELAANAADLQVWQRSVNGLIARMEEILRAADTDNVLKIDVRPRQLREEGFGSYMLPSLSVDLGARHMEAVPVARRVVAGYEEGPVRRRASGRVDLTNGAEKYYLYRFVDESGEESWKIVDDEKYRWRPFDQAEFESAIRRLLE